MTQMPDGFVPSHVANKTTPADVRYKTYSEAKWNGAFAEVGIPLDYPGSERLKSIAYEKGHHDGWGNIVDALEDVWRIVVEIAGPPCETKKDL